MNMIEVELYLNQFKGFFDKNPNDLIDLIGDILKNDFYHEVKNQSIVNYENGDEVSLTHKQIIDIVIKLKKTITEIEVSEKVDNIFQKTSFGQICLN